MLVVADTSPINYLVLLESLSEKVTLWRARRRLRTRERGAVEVISATCRRTLRGWT
jgi:hypothetical protein